MLKIKLEFTFEDEEMQDIFESYSKKFTKKRLAELKTDLKDNGGTDDFAQTLRDDVANCIGEWIDSMFDDE